MVYKKPSRLAESQTFSFRIWKSQDDLHIHSEYNSITLLRKPNHDAVNVNCETIESFF